MTYTLHINVMYYYIIYASPSVNVQIIVMSMHVCMYLCWSVHLKNQLQTSHGILDAYAHVAVARSFYGKDAMRYVFTVLWMTSCLSIIVRHVAARKGRLGLLNVTHQGGTPKA